MNEPELIREILTHARTLAVIGLTDREGRASLGVSRWMQRQGYRIVPVNPQISSVLGEVAYPSLEEAVLAVGTSAFARGAGDPFPPTRVDHSVTVSTVADHAIDLVLVFRAPEFVPAIVEETIRLGLRYLWLQEGVIHEQAATQAEEAGVKVVMDRCIAKERMASGWNAE